MAKEAGFPEERIKLLLMGFEKNTWSGYSRYLNTFVEWMKKKDITLTAASTKEQWVATTSDAIVVLSESLSYNALCTMRSAISSIYTIVFNKELGDDKGLSLVMRALLKTKPPRMMEIPTTMWRMEQMLSVVRTMGDNGTMDLNELTLKTVVLFMMFTAC